MTLRLEEVSKDEEKSRTRRRKSSSAFQIGSRRLDAEAIRNELIEFISRYEERLSNNEEGFSLFLSRA